MDGTLDRRKRPASIDYWNDAVKKPRTDPPVPSYSSETTTPKRPTVQTVEGNRHDSYTVPPRDGSAVLPSPRGTMIPSPSPLSAEASRVGSVSRGSTPQSAVLLSHGRAPLAQTRASQNTSAQTTSPRATRIFAQLESFAASITAKNLTAFNRDVAQTRFEQICREIDENAQHLASFPTLLEQKNHVKDQAAKVLEDLNKKLLQRKGAQVLVMLELANEIESCQLAATTTPAAYSEAENLKLEKPLRVTKDTVDGQDRAIKTLRDEVSALRESVKTTEAFKMAARDELNRLQGDINRLIDWKLRVETNNKAFEADIIESKRDGRELDEVVRRHRDDHRAVARKVEEVDEAVESQRARLSVVLKDQSVDTEALKAKIDTNKVNLEKLVKEMRKTHADVRKLVDTEIDTVHAGLKTLSDEVDLMKASQSSMKLDFLSKHVTPSGDDTLKLSSDLAALTLTVDTHSSKLKALREDLGENDNEGLRKVVAAQGDTLYGHDIQLADASTDRDKLWDRINELQPGSGDIAEQDLETLERPQASPVVPHRPREQRD